MSASMDAPARAVRRARRRRSTGLDALLGLALAICLAGTAQAQMPRTIEKPGAAETAKNQRQRELVDTLARRRLGTRLHACALTDIGVLQRLFDERVVEREDVFTQQAAGVVLGDVMVRNLRLDWVVVDDEYGRSRALRYRDTPSLFFPVTMLSKRIEHDERISVRALYDEVAREVERLEARERPSRRPIALTPRPGPETAAEAG